MEIYLNQNKSDVSSIKEEMVEDLSVSSASDKENLDPVSNPETKSELPPKIPEKTAETTAKVYSYRKLKGCFLFYRLDCTL